MKLFKRKQETINTKFKVKDQVSFRYKGDFRIGLIYKVHVNEGIATYDIQVGGECPTLFYNIAEDVIYLMKS